MDISLIILLIVICIVIIIAISVFVISRMKGKISINLSKYNYSSGDTINGQVILKLNKLAEANGLNIRLIGEKQNRTFGRRGNNSNKQVIFDFVQPLDGEKLYPAGEQTYNFSIKIPQNKDTNLEGIAGTVVKSIQLLAGQSNLIKWHLVSTLEVRGINVKSKMVQVNIA